MRVLICDPDAQTLDSLAEAVRSLNLEVVPVNTGQECLNIGSVNIAFISENIEDVMWDNLVSALARQGTTVYVLTNQINLDLLQQTIKAGGKAVYSRDAQEITKVLSRLPVAQKTAGTTSTRPLRRRLERDSAPVMDMPVHQSQAQPRVNQRIEKQSEKIIVHNNKLVVFYAFKGGVGKSLLSVCTAVALANCPNTKLKVAVVDFDAFNGDTAKILGIKPNRTILDWLNKDTDNVNEFLTEHESGIQILPAPHAALDGIAIDREAAKRILSSLTLRFDVVIVDATHIPRESVMVAIESASKVFMLSTPDRVTLMDNSKIAETFDMSRVDMSNFHLIINRMPKKPPLRLSDYREVLPWEPSVVIPEDPTVQKIINDGGIPVLDRRAKSFTHSVYQMCNIILPVFNTQQSGFKWPKLFSRSKRVAL